MYCRRGPPVHGDGTIDAGSLHCDPTFTGRDTISPFSDYRYSESPIPESFRRQSVLSAGSIDT